MLRIIIIYIIALTGSFPFNIAQGIAPGPHNLQVYSQQAEDLTPDDLVGGAQFTIECMCTHD